ncbi:hypothetical protein ECG_06139 [Echinococcus granulosus]|nr:hypothetical protein ECG_06139 [Echinococcus granulosus]
MSSDSPNFFMETSPPEGGNHAVHSPSEGSSEVDTSSFDASMRHFVYSDLPINAPTPAVPAPSTMPMRLKPGNKKSFVWNYFRHPEGESGMVDRTRTQCLLCKSQLAFNASGTTTTMLNHLKSRHGEIAQREESQRVRSNTSNRRKDTATSRVASGASYSPLRAQQQSSQSSLPPPPSQVQPSRMRNSNGCSDFPQISEDLRKFAHLKEEAKQTSRKVGLLQPFLALSGLDTGGRHGSPQVVGSPESIATAAEAAAAAAAAAAASSGLLPPSVSLGGLPQLPAVTSSPLIPPLFPIPPPLESAPLMPQLTGFLPPNFPAFVPPNSSASSCSTDTDDAMERLQSTPQLSSDSGPLAVARAWLSTLANLPGQTATNGNLAAIEELLKSLPSMAAQQAGAGSSSKPLLMPPLPPDLLSTLVHNSPLVLSILSRSQALLASQGCIPPPPAPPPPPPPPLSTSSATLTTGPSTTASASTPSLPSSKDKSSSNSVDLMIGTAKRKRTRPVYIPPQMWAVKRSSIEGSPGAADSPEDLSMPRATRQQQHELSTGALETCLAYFLVREMLPPEILEREGFRTLVNELIGSTKALSIPRITARQMRMEILPQIANTVLPTQQQTLSRSSLAVEFWHNMDGRQNFANLSIGCEGRLLQTALLKCPADVKKIIVDCVGSSEKTAMLLPRALVTNRPEELHEIMSGDFTIVPCFVTALAASVTSGFRAPEVIALLRDMREATGLPPNFTNITTVETISWREVADLMVRVRAERQNGDVWQLKCLLDNLGRSFDDVKQQAASCATVSLITQILINLRKTHLATTSEDSEVIEAFKTAVNERLDVFYPRKPNSLSDLLLIAGLTDPRVRTRVHEFAPQSVNLLKEKVEELSRLRDKDEVFVHTAHCEVDRYLREEVKSGVQTDPFQWWSERQTTYPLLSRLARHYLAIPLASFNTQLRLKPLPRSTQRVVSSALPDGLNLPNYCDIFAQLKMNLFAEDMLIYTFLWHNWSLPSSQGK